MAVRRTVIDSAWLNRGQVISGLSLDRITFEDCRAEFGPADSSRPTVQDCRFSGVVARGCSLVGAVLRDVTVDGLRSDNFSGFVFGNEFHHVVLKGRIRFLALNINHNDDEVVNEYRDRLRQAERESDWTLDISEADGGVEIRGYDADRIRINPETQAVIRRENVADGRWREFDPDGTAWVPIKMLLANGWANTVLVANSFSPRFEDEVRAIQRLREEGIAE